VDKVHIGILGGGNLGGALALLASSAGHDVRIGQREIGPLANGLDAVALEAAAAHGDVVVIAVPFAACAEVLSPLSQMLAGKIVVDATNPLNTDWSPLLLGQENSAAEEIARMLPASRVVKAFNTVFADAMTPQRLPRRGGQRLTAFVASDDDVAAATVAELAQSMGFAPQSAGVLTNARHLEAMAHLNIAIAVGGGGGTDAGILYDRAGG
jgi:8-hydroxy-5-deazaflavin:NADPH oxidoreductase